MTAAEVDVIPDSDSDVAEVVDITVDSNFGSTIRASGVWTNCWV